MSFTLSIEDPIKLKRFKKCLQTITSFTESFNMNLSKKNLFISTLDGMRICILNCSLHKSFFSKYSFTRNIVVGMSSESVIRMCKCIESKDSLFDEKNTVAFLESIGGKDIEVVQE